MGRSRVLYELRKMVHYFDETGLNPFQKMGKFVMSLILKILALRMETERKYF
jgi:hypothetical protein